MVFHVLCYFISLKSFNLFWNSKRLGLPPPHLLCGMLHGLQGCYSAFFFFFLTTFVWNLTSILLFFIFIWKIVSLNFQRAGFKMAFLSFFLSLSICVFCYPIVQTVAVCSPALPGSARSPSSIWTWFFLCLCCPVSFSSDPPPAVLLPERSPGISLEGS